MTTVVRSGRGIYSDKEMRGAVLFAKLIGLLMLPDSEPGRSYNELAEESGLCVHTVRRYVLAMREARPKVAYICGWDLDVRGNPSIRLFKLGNKRDAPRPKKTNAERLRQQAARKKQKRIQNAIAGVTQCPTDQSSAAPA